MIRSTSLYNRFRVDFMYNNNFLQDEKGNNIFMGLKMEWRLPQQGFEKLNTDGSCKNSSIAAGGGVIRNEDGTWLVGFSIKFKAINPAAAELITIREGLITLKKFNTNHLELEADAEALKMMLENVDKFSNHELSALIQDVAAFLREDWIVILLYVKRNANEVAHCLAKFGIQMENFMKIHYGIPACTEGAYNKDAKKTAIQVD